jgi:hypothetical protein
LQNDAEQNITVTVAVEATHSKVLPSLEIQARVHGVGDREMQKKKKPKKRRKEPED